jgi:hypothetical protein
MKTKDEINAENAMMRLQLETLYNGKAYRSEESSIPPEIENIFLKNVINFEKQYQQAPRIQFRERLDGLYLPPENSLTEGEIEFYLEQAIRQFDRHNIDFLYEEHQDRRVVYKYLVEHLLDEEFDDIKVEGMRQVIFFEEHLDGEEE